MGFYGKVEHTDRLNFVIDKIYPNRKTMDDNVNNDEVFIGRYVLIEYEQTEKRSYLRLYKKGDSLDLYFSIDLDPSTRAQNDNPDGDYYVAIDEIVYVLDDRQVQQFYKCTGKDVSGNAVFAACEKPYDANTYHENYSIDIEEYGESRGFDSTVWQKIYVDEAEKYVMIAELNSVVPTFDITVDAPSLNPIPPHFDSDSNNVYYRLHVQPAWSFKVKEAQDGEPSDEYIDADLVEWDEVNKTLNVKDRVYRGAIYFNRDSLSPDYHYNVNDDESINHNYIQVSTEASGRKYNTSHGTVEEAHDTQALEIILPSIGKAVSDMWDMAFGTGEAIENDTTKTERNKDISWDNVNGLRLVKTSRDPKNPGFTYDIKGVETIAGCINSVHDLMGMIVVDDSNNSLKDKIDDALINRIYYRDGQYWIKDLTYEYKDVPDTDQKIENMKQFSDNYYYKNGKNYYLEQEGYQAGNQYYELDNNIIKTVDLYNEPWQPNYYYYLDEKNNSYILDDGKYPTETRKYYKIAQDISSIKNVVNNKQGDTNLCFFPSNYSTSTYNALFPTVRPTKEGEKGKGLFYLGTDASGKTGYLPYEQGKNIPYQTPLYYWVDYEIEISTTTSGAFIETYDFNKAKSTRVNMVKFEENSYYYRDENLDWILLKSQADIDLNRQYYQFGKNGVEKIAIEKPFYKPDTYYYKDYVDYIKELKEERAVGVTYYNIPESAIEQVKKDVVFYEPNKYYYYDENGNLKLDTNETMTPGRQYYKDIYTLYVKEDANNIYGQGTKWNPEAMDIIPDGVVLGYREEIYQWKKLIGFARSLNTIHGLILKLNSVLKLDDKLTRDPKTVQGCINQINDIIKTIGQLKPNHFVAIDEYGRMTSMAQQTDSWIDVKINNGNNDKVIITHTGPVVSNETAKAAVSPAFGETFEIEDWYFDAKGHKSNKTIHTVKIPQGSLTDNTKSGSNIITQLSFTPSSGALATTRENLSTIKLAGYTKGTNNADVAASDTLGTALSKLQTQIIEEENNRASANNSLNAALNQEISDRQAAIAQEVKDRDAAIAVETAAREKAVSDEVAARKAAIEALDAEITTETYEVISAISEVNGKISVGANQKRKVGELTLNGLVYGDGTNTAAVNDTDTISGAFVKVQNQLNVLKGNSSTVGSVAYQIAQMVINADDNASIDKLSEIAAWIASDTTGAAKMNKDILDNTTRIEDLEELVGNQAVAIQIANAVNNALLIDGVNKYALAADLINLSNTVGTINSRVQNLELAVSAEKIAQWDAAEVNVQSDWTETDETADSYIKNKPTLDFVSMETYNALLERIAALEARIEALENPVVEEPTPDPENPEEPVE